MFKKIEIWILYLIIIFSFVGIIFFSSLVKYKIEGGKGNVFIDKIADISLSNPSLFNIGDQVKFEALNNIEEYDSIKKLSKNNKYKPTIKNV